jgi:hypothetical protein
MMRSKETSQLIRIIAKSLILLLAINYGLIFLEKLPFTDFSSYNTFFTGRERLPFGETPTDSYSLTMNNIDAMLASHRINENPGEDNFRIAVIGDSSIWGFLQENNNTLVGILNNKYANQCFDKKIQFFNLGYPSLSILKDLLIIDGIQKYEPDLIIWFITLESLPEKEQLTSPLVLNNPLLINEVIDKYDLDFEKNRINQLGFTLIKRKRELADIWRLQLYGIPWSATGIDQVIPESYSPAQRDFERDEEYKNIAIGELSESDLALDVIRQAEQAIKTDLVIINEPILISNGSNSDIRYNFYYPRWAYDSYREIAKKYMIENELKYYDLWNTVPESEFTNSAIHLSIEGQKILAKRVNDIINEYCTNPR